jgi:asparagine synthase (glutamine-hydrolysing)
MYVRGGQQRWLARELGRGMMPEAQREDTRWGFHNADWHARTSKDLGRLRREIEAAGDDPVLNDILDVPRALKAVDEWPETSQYDPESYNRFVMGLPRAVLMARFVRFASGRN